MGSIIETFCGPMLTMKDFIIFKNRSQFHCSPPLSTVPIIFYLLENTKIQSVKIQKVTNTETQKVDQRSSKRQRKFEDKEHCSFKSASEKSHHQVAGFSNTSTIQSLKECFYLRETVWILQCQGFKISTCQSSNRLVVGLVSCHPCIVTGSLVTTNWK